MAQKRVDLCISGFPHILTESIAEEFLLILTFPWNWKWSALCFSIFVFSCKTRQLGRDLLQMLTFIVANSASTECVQQRKLISNKESSRWKSKKENTVGRVDICFWGFDLVTPHKKAPSSAGKGEGSEDPLQGLWNALGKAAAGAAVAANVCINYSIAVRWVVCSRQCSKRESRAQTA